MQVCKQVRYAEINLKLTYLYVCVGVIVSIKTEETIQKIMG